MPASHNCLWTVWLVDPGAQELPDSLGGRGCLGGAEQQLVDSDAN
jgi:hypothetical protein